MAAAWFSNHSSWFVFQSEDIHCLCIHWILQSDNVRMKHFCSSGYHTRSDSIICWCRQKLDGSLLFSFASCCSYCNHLNSMSILQVTIVFATKLKSFNFVPLLKRLPADNRVWKKVLKASRPNKVRTTHEPAQYGSCYVCHTVSLKNITVQGTG